MRRTGRKRHLASAQTGPFSVRFNTPLLLAALVWLAKPLWAQVDIESLRRDDQAGFFGSVAIDLTLRAGNVELFECGPELSLSYSRVEDTFIFIGSGDLGWEGKERFSNEALAHLRYVRAVASRLHGEAFGQVNYDRSRRLDFRGLVGGGIRWALIAPGESSFWLGSSLMFEHERNELTPADDHAAQTSLVRWSNYLSADIELGEAAQLAGTAYVQPAVRQFDDYRVLWDVVLKVSITEALSSTTSVAFQRDSDPLKGVAGSDFSLTTGLALDWN
ncbi:MAG: DUF481 domain-containing protein [Gemmatimonadota bacterium]|nr:DUF481 domain-containing protein [Gemmatimonadota bacterium]